MVRVINCDPDFTFSYLSPLDTSIMPLFFDFL
jgi:hypothetical protein